MRVVLAKKLLSSVGGSEAQARALALALAARGHDVTVVAMRPAWRRPGMPEALYDAPPGDVQLVSAGITYRYLQTRAGRIGAAVDGVLPTELVRTEALRDAFRGADVVHSLAREWVLSIERAARAAGTAFVETPLVHPGQRASGAGRGDVRRYRRVDAVLALTEWEARWYRARGVRNVHVTGIGPILADVPAVSADPATILFVGRKERYKGYHALRHAARIVWRTRPDARFVAIGQRAFADAFRRWPRDDRWEDRGVVSEDAKAEAYARCTIFCMPSSHETFGHAYLEAWCAGRPVIAGDIPPLHEVMREGIDGLHCRNDPADIAHAILRLLADPEHAAAMGASGKRRVEERWTWPAISELTERAYLSCA